MSVSGKEESEGLENNWKIYVIILKMKMMLSVGNKHFILGMWFKSQQKCHKPLNTRHWQRVSIAQGYNAIGVTVLYRSSMYFFFSFFFSQAVWGF